MYVSRAKSAAAAAAKLLQLCLTLCDPIDGHQRKPNPYPLEHIMAKYSLSPAELLVVDDMKPAWEMASKAGVPVAFAAWSKIDIPEIAEEMTRLCNFSFSSPKELEKFLFD